MGTRATLTHEARPGAAASPGWQVPARPLAAPGEKAAAAQGALRGPGFRFGDVPIHAGASVGRPEGALEAEADETAERVMRMESPASASRGPVTVQRKPATGEAAETAETAVVDEARRTPGEPLDAGTRAFMEPRFGHDFSAVRVHADGRAAQSAEAMGALAYTLGTDVVFGAGQYAPATGDGAKLLAHELTHVVQQGGAAGSARPIVQKKPAAAKPAVAEPKIGPTEARQIMDVIEEILDADGLPIMTEDAQGLGHVSMLPPGAAALPPRWADLVLEWSHLVRGQWQDAKGYTVSYPGDMLSAHVTGAVARTAPVVDALRAADPTWSPERYLARVAKLRARAASEAVSEVIDRTAAGGKGDLQLAGMTEVAQLQLATTEAIRVVRAVMTVSTRVASAHPDPAREVHSACGDALGDSTVPTWAQETPPAPRASAARSGSRRASSTRRRRS